MNANAIGAVAFLLVALAAGVIVVGVTVVVVAVAVALVKSYHRDRGEMKAWFAVTFSAVAGLAAAAWFVWWFPWQ